jgi:PAS domain-containing protein
VVRNFSAPVATVPCPRVGVCGAAPGAPTAGRRRRPPRSGRRAGPGLGASPATLTGVILSVLSESLPRSRRRILACERRYAVTLASIGDAVIATDGRARVAYQNPAAEALTGRPLAEVFRVVNDHPRCPRPDRPPGGRRASNGSVVSGPVARNLRSARRFDPLRLHRRAFGLTVAAVPAALPTADRGRKGEPGNAPRRPATGTAPGTQRAPPSVSCPPRSSRDTVAHGYSGGLPLRRRMP